MKCAMVSQPRSRYFGMGRSLSVRWIQRRQIALCRTGRAPDDKTEVLLRTMVLGLKGHPRHIPTVTAIEEHRR